MEKQAKENKGHLFRINESGPLTETAELGGLVPYPDETDATDHLRVSALK